MASPWEAASKYPQIACIIHTFEICGFKAPKVKTKRYAEDFEWKSMLVFNECHMTQIKELL